ncbi:MAG: hypothetical protein PVJ67_00270 [Candidatus Pacearchaeota archaeon]|jgi:hypothetical protein
MSWDSINNVAHYTLCVLDDLEKNKDMIKGEVEYLGRDSAGLFATMRSYGPDWRSVEKEYGNNLLLVDLNEISFFSRLSTRILKKVGYPIGKSREKYSKKIKGFEGLLKKIAKEPNNINSIRENKDYTRMVSFLKELERITSRDSCSLE